MKTSQKPGTIHVAVRFEAAIVARIDDLRPFLSTPWLRAKRSDALRALVMKALPLMEAEAATKRRKGTKPKAPKGTS